MRTLSGNNQIPPWLLCFLYLCWQYHIQWGHRLLVELKLSPNLNHSRDHKWGRMFWNFIELKQTITLPDKKYFTLQKWCSADTNISVRRCKKNTSIISNLYCMICMKNIWLHSSNLSALTNPLTKLTHIAKFSLCEPPMNNNLSNCSLLTLMSDHFVKSCCSAVLIFQTNQKWWW